MILHSQQTHVRRRLSQDYSTSPTPASPTASSPDFSSSSSSSSSPSRHSSPRRSSPKSRRTSSLSHHRSSSFAPIPELPDAESSALALSLDESKLADISNKIKSTLIDLINCDDVKGDARMRSWCATRLMDVEHELKDSKRRRHSDESVDLSARE